MTNPARDRSALSPRQAEVLAAIQSYAADRHQTPTVLELSLLIGLNTATINGHLRALKRKGRIQWWPGRGRNIQLIEREEPKS